MDEITHQGFWWLPEDPDHAVAGTLILRHSERPTLELIGTLHDRGFSSTSFEPEFILGVSSNRKKITLYRCAEVNRNTNLGSGLVVSKLSAALCFVGDHFSSNDQLVFPRFAVSYDQLSDWAWLTGFRFSIGQDPATKHFQRYELAYEFPDIHEANVGDFRVRFSPHFSQSGGPIDEYRLHQTMFLEVRPNHPMPLEWYLDTFYHLRNFITLGVGRPLVPIHMRATISVETVEGTELESPATVDVYRQVDREISSKKKVHPAQMLFSFPRIRPYYEQALQIWFQKAPLLRPVYDLYFSTLYNPRQYLEGRFLSLAQAVETYHRRQFGGAYLSGEAYDGLKRQLLDVVSGYPMDSDVRDAFSGKVQYLNEFSLRRRVKDLVSLFGTVIDRFIPNASRFASQVVDTRNYLTHYNPLLQSSAAQDQALYHLTEQLRLLLEFCLLREIGLPEDVREGLVSEHQRYIQLKMMLNRPSGA